MKRLGCLFLIMILALISASALAEQFTLRDGIQFGMSIDEIKKIEQEAGYEVEESFGYHDGSDDDVYLTLEVDNLAGIGGSVDYHFSVANKGLNACTYCFSSNVGDGYEDKDVVNLINAYSDKYGDTVATGDGFVDIPGEATDAVDSYAFIGNSLVGRGIELKNYCQWIYSLDDGDAVDIMLLECYMPILDTSEVYVSYSYRSPSEMQAVYDMVQEKQAAVDSDV